MGCGRVGSTLARSLERRDHSVSIIDVDVDAFRRLGPDFRGTTVKGVGFDRDVLVKADIRSADGFAAVSSGDNSNILAARVVREEFGVTTVAARIYDQGRAEVFEKLGIPTVAPVRWTANQVMRRLLPQGSEPAWRDPSGTVRLAQIYADPGWIGHRIAELSDHARTPLPILIRYGKGMTTDASTVYQEGDVLYAAIDTDRVSDVEALLASGPTKP